MAPWLLLCTSFDLWGTSLDGRAYSLSQLFQGKFQEILDLGNDLALKILKS